MNTASRCAYGNTLVVLASGLLGSLAVCCSVSPEEGVKDPDSSRPVGEVIFEFGREDKSDSEFRSHGLEGTAEYRCRVGADCSTEAFPAYLNRAGDTAYDYGGVERIIVSFRLQQTCNDLILRLARGGDETTVVKVDRRRAYLVTNTMLGSSEGFRVGVCNLKLGALKKGEHRIELTVADDGKGNATYQWDALSFVARKP
jgi:hypothetical protein